MNKLYLLLLFGLGVCKPFFAQATQPLELGLSISTSAQREAFYSLAQEFMEENEDVDILITALTSEDYKQRFPELIRHKNQYDVLYWHSGARLEEFIEKNWVASVSDLWLQDQLDDAFDDSIVDSIRFGEHIYGLPISYYQIGFYYNKPLFKKHGLTEPQTWSDFLTLCKQLKALNVIPIFIGTKSNWPATAWFDYLNIRINGLAFHKATTRGKVSFLDERFTKLFTIWSVLNENNYFNTEHQKVDWKQGLPLLYRGMIGMTMIGNYVIQDIPERIIDDIGYFPFPHFDPDKNVYEEAPVDILIIPSNSDNKELAKRFLQFAARSDIQSKLNNTLGVLSPRRDAQISKVSLVNEAYRALDNADGLTQFFDRDARASYADKIMPIIDQFMLDNDVAGVQSSLESVRLREYIPSGR